MAESSSGMGPALQFGALMAGVVIAWSGFKGRSPWAEVTAVLRGTPAPTAAPTAGQSSTAPTNPTTAASTGSDTSSPCCGGPAPTLVDIPGHPGFRLTPAAAASLAAVEAKIGYKITLTGTYRTCEVQTAANIADSGRFAKPCSSAHPKGLAIDGPNSPKADFIAAMGAAGWHRARPADEPWHWSYGITA